MYTVISMKMLHVFRSEDELVDWLRQFFDETDDRGLAYRSLVSENVDAVLDLCMRNASEKTVLPLVRSLDCIQRTYGNLYDPSGSLFILERRLS